MGYRGEIINYTHTANPMYYLQSYNPATGEVTCTAPHNLTVGSKYDALINIQNMPFPDQTKAVYVPKEWLQTQIKIYATGATTFIVQNTGGTALTVNTADTNNASIDITQFHFETFVAWNFSNLPKLKRMKLLLQGYIRTNYRYSTPTVAYTDGTTSDLSYVALLGAGTGSIFDPTLYVIEDWDIEILPETKTCRISTKTQSFWVYASGSYFSQSNVAFNTSGTSKFTKDITNGGIIGFRPFSATYFFCSNGTNIKIYDLDAQEKLTSNITVSAVSNVYTLDLSQSTNFSIETMDTNAKTITFSNISLSDNQITTICVNLKYTNAVNFTYPTGTTWKDGQTPILTIGKNYVLMFTTSNKGTSWQGSWVGAW